MSRPHKSGEEDGGGRRLYKLVGALVVALVIAAALVPLWLGGGEEQQTRLVKVQPDNLNGPSEEEGGSEGPQGAGDSERQAPADEDGGKWWQPGDSESGAGGAEEAPSAPSPEKASEPEASAQASAKDKPAPAQETQDEAAGPNGDVAAPRQEADEAPDEGSRAPGDGSPKATAEEQKAESDRPYWTVMVGSFQDPANARGLKDRLGEQGYATEVVTKTIEGQKWRRVYAGREGSRDQAEEVMTRLKEAGYDDLLVLQTE